jgi:hypothetical protein
MRFQVTFSFFPDVLYVFQAVAKVLERAALLRKFLHEFVFRKVKDALQGLQVMRLLLTRNTRSDLLTNSNIQYIANKALAMICISSLRDTITQHI